MTPGKELEGGTPFGAEWLFERWPFRKIRSFHIGAIELPQRKDALVPFALDLMEEPFELTGKAAKRTRRALYQSIAVVWIRRSGQRRSLERSRRYRFCIVPLSFRSVFCFIETMRGMPSPSTVICRSTATAPLIHSPRLGFST